MFVTSCKTQGASVAGLRAHLRGIIITSTRQEAFRPRRLRANSKHSPGPLQIDAPSVSQRLLWRRERLGGRRRARLLPADRDISDATAAALHSRGWIIDNVSEQALAPDSDNSDPWEVQVLNARDAFRAWSGGYEDFPHGRVVRGLRPRYY